MIDESEETEFEMSSLTLVPNENDKTGKNKTVITIRELIQSPLIIVQLLSQNIVYLVILPTGSVETL